MTTEPGSASDSEYHESREPVHILLADDDADYRATVTRVLLKRGHHVSAVEDGLQALLYLDDGVDLLVTDIQMPRLDGEGLLTTLRERFPDLPVIVVSGESPSGPQAEELRARAQALFGKPIPVEEFLRTVKRLGTGGKPAGLG